MSDDDLENDELEVGDDDEADDSLDAAAVDDDVTGEADDSVGDDAAPKAKGKAKAAVSVDECQALKPRTKSVMLWPVRWKSSSLKAAKWSKSSPTW